MKAATIFLVLISMAISVKAASGVSADVTTKIDALFRDFDHPNAPGASVMVIHNGKSIFAKGYGLANLESKTPCTTNTNFRLASVTKQFTAMAVMMLVEEKKVMLDECLTNFFPGFPSYGKQITVRHLLTHTSGLIEYDEIMPEGTTIPVLDQDVLRLLIEQTGDAPSAGVRTVAWSEDTAKNQAALQMELEKQKASAANKQKRTTYFPPGTRYSYSNTGFALLALIVEARSGQKFSRFLQEHIFEPLKMSNTLAYEQGLLVVPNRAYGHTQTPKGWQRTDQSLTSSVLGDGGVYSSVTDLFKWDQALYKSKLVSEPMLRAAFSPAVQTDKPGRSYGYGWFISEYRGVKEVFHSGDTIGFRTRIARFPDKKFTVIILANRADAKLDELPHKIADLVVFK